jgi:hypothetical protein
MCWAWKEASKPAYEGKIQLRNQKESAGRWLQTATAPIGDKNIIKDKATFK